MADLEKDDVAKTLLVCFKGIRISFKDAADMRAYTIAALNKELAKVAGSDWNAPVESFANVIRIEFYRRGYEILDLDGDWFDTNKDGTVEDLVGFIDSHYVEL